SQLETQSRSIQITLKLCSATRPSRQLDILHFPKCNVWRPCFQRLPCRGASVTGRSDLVLLIGRSEAQNDDWIDPTDMLNYDAASGTMRKPDKHVNQDDFENNRLPPTKVAEENLMEISRCQKKLDSAIQKPNDNTREVHYDAEIILNKQSVNEINKFLKEEDWKSASLDEAVNSILINCRPHDYEAWKWKFEDTFGVDPYNVFMVLLCLASISVIIATELWTRKAFAQHQSEVAKMGNVDKICVEKIRWTDSFWEFQSKYMKRKKSEQ
ncbi:putative Chloride channel CLIC-like protein, partial [Naja naja]